MTPFRRYGLGARVYDLASGERLVYRAGRVAGIRALGLRTGDAVLDLGCGTGLNLPLLTTAVGASGLVIAVDRSPDMLRMTRRRVFGAGWSNVVSVEADVMTLEPSRLIGLAAESGHPGGLDAAIATYSLSVLSDWRRGWEVMAETIRPGGRAGIVDMALPVGAARLLAPLALLACASGGCRHPRAPLDGTRAGGIGCRALDAPWRTRACRDGHAAMSDPTESGDTGEPGTASGPAGSDGDAGDFGNGPAEPGDVDIDDMGNGPPGRAVLDAAPTREASDRLLAVLRDGGYRPEAWSRFVLLATRRSVVQARRHPLAFWQATAIHAAAALLSTRRGRVWVLTSWVMAVTHLGMLEDRRGLGLANQLTLARGVLPSLAPRLGRALPILALATDFADGRIARGTGWVTPFGTQADFLADTAFWSWFIAKYEPSRVVKVATAAAWAAPVVGVFGASIARGRVLDLPRSAWFRPAAVVEVIVGARAIARSFRGRR